MAKLFDPTDFGFALTEQQQMMIDTWTRFRKNTLDDHILERTRAEEYSPEIHRQMGDLGFFGQWFPDTIEGGLHSEEDPVTERDVATLAIKICEDNPAEYLGCASSFALVGIQILGAGTEEQKQDFLPRILSGEHIASFCLTEPDGGSNALKYGGTTIKEEGDHYILNGSKTFISNGSFADLYYVFCRDASFEKGNPMGIRSILVRREDADDSDQIFAEPLKNKIGLRTSDTSTVIFDNVRVPKDRLVIQPGMFMDAQRIAEENLVKERLGAIYMAVGIARGALKRLLPYLGEERKLQRGDGIKVPLQFGTVKDPVRDMISRFVEKQDTCFSIVDRIDRGEPISNYMGRVMREKVDTVQMAIDTCTESIHLMGGYGIMDEYHFGRLWGDAMTLAVGGGTVHVQNGILHNLYGFPR